jgi:branched-subunit amino acid aminotransferase/4-amino-4-deoxychorismate lyase
LTAHPLADYPAELYERGMRAAVANVRRNETSPLSRVKCAAGLLDGLLAREQARAAGFDEAVMLNTRDLVAEATVANVFVVTSGRLLTPPVASGALLGVTRAAVLDLASEAQLDAGEKEITLHELAGAEEAFLTNAIMGVMPLTQVADSLIGHGRPGPVTTQLHDAYLRAAG